MKVFFLSLLLLSFSIHAELIEIVDFQEGERWGTLELQEKESKYSSVLLDCSSFLHGVYLDEKFFYLYHDECHEIYDSINDWIFEGDKVCLSLDFKTKDWSLRRSQDSCR